MTELKWLPIEQITYDELILASKRDYWLDVVYKVYQPVEDNFKFVRVCNVEFKRNSYDHTDRLRNKGMFELFKEKEPIEFLDAFCLYNKKTMKYETACMEGRPVFYRIEAAIPNKSA